MDYNRNSNYEEEEEHALPMERDCCQYCGNRDGVCLAKCAVCGRFFCNGLGLKEGSHLTIHMKLSKHNSFQVYSRKGIAMTTPKCKICGCTNVFDLRVLRDAKGSVSQILCLEKCIASMKITNPAYKAIKFYPVVERDGVISEIIPKVECNPHAPVKVEFPLICKIERMWSKHSQLTITEVRLPRGVLLPPMNDFYRDTLQYYTVIEPLLRREVYEQKEKASQDGSKHIYVTFQRQVKTQQVSYNNRYPTDRYNRNSTVEENVMSVIATFSVNLEDYHRKIRRFDDLVLTKCEIQDDYDAENDIGKKKVRKYTTLDGLVNGKIKQMELDDLNDSADLGQYTLDYHSRIEYTGRIISMNEGRIVMRVLTNQLPEYERKFQAGYYDIRLIDSQAVLQRRLTAIKLMDNEEAVTQYLYNKWMGDKRLPNHDSFQYRRGELSTDGVVRVEGLGSLNPSQVIAVETAIKRRLSLIQGPPGTGKTMTAAAIIYFLIQRHRAGIKDVPLDGSKPTLPGNILVCTPSNVSADEICLRIAMTGVKVVRLMASSRETDPSPIEELCVHYRARKLLLRSDAEFRRLDALWQEDDTDMTEKDEKSRYVMMMKKKGEIVDSAEVVVCTCDTSGCSLLREKHFNTVLVDEVSQSSEPETLVPVVHGSERLILVGDHKQLAPVIVSLPVKKAGMERSIFERLVHQGETPILLDTQYRMHPAISEYPSETFYSGKLRNGVSAKQRPVAKQLLFSNMERPCEFICVYGEEETSSDGTSYINMAEALYVLDLLRYLIQKGIKPSQIGVLTSYSGQRRLLLKSLIKVEIDEVEVASVNTFQGREKDYIIYSCVRSNNMNTIGFSSDMRRLNVVLTRGKYGLFMIGNPLCLSVDRNWKSFIDFNLEHNLLVEGSPGQWKQVKEYWIVC